MEAAWALPVHQITRTAAMAGEAAKEGVGRHTPVHRPQASHMGYGTFSVAITGQYFGALNSDREIDTVR